MYYNAQIKFLENVENQHFLIMEWIIEEIIN